MYHKVDPKPELGLSCVHPKTFEKQIDFLISKGFHLVTLSQLETESMSNDKRIAICFDDGYKGVIEHAYPILKKYSVAATVFIITNFIGRKNTWDVNLGGIQYEHLSREDIQKLVDAGWEIGSHSVSHQSLRGVDKQELQYQLRHSKATLEKIIKQPVHVFTAPFGTISNRINTAALKSGYHKICGFFPIKFYKGAIPKGVVLRLAVYRSDGLNSIERKLSGDRRLYFEIIKQNVINFCSNATIAVNTLR